MYSLDGATYNTAVGMQALSYATGHYNTAMGANAGAGSNTGMSNTMIGADAGFTQGSYNTAVGTLALNPLNGGSGGDYNTAVGNEALSWLQAVYGGGNQNVSVGDRSGRWLQSGNGNVFLGAHADAGSGYTTGSNRIALGYGALATANNQMVIGGSGVAVTFPNGSDVFIFAPITEVIPGKTNTTTLGSSSNAWSTVYTTLGTVITSDGRVKSNQQTITNGLGTLLRLQPKTYFKQNSQFVNGSLVLEAGGAEEAGFIAQDVSGIIPTAVYRPEDDTKALWGMRYEQVIPYTVSAVQELKAENDALKGRVEALEAKLAALLAKLPQ